MKKPGKTQKKSTPKPSHGFPIKQPTARKVPAAPVPPVSGESLMGDNIQTPKKGGFPNVKR